VTIKPKELNLLSVGQATSWFGSASRTCEVLPRCVGHEPDDLPVSLRR